MNTLILVHKKREDRKQRAGKQDLLPPTVTWEGTSFVQTTVWFSFTAHSKQCLLTGAVWISSTHCCPFWQSAVSNVPPQTEAVTLYWSAALSLLPNLSVLPEVTRWAHWWGCKEGVLASQSACPRTGPLGKDHEQIADRQPLVGAPSRS